MTKVWDEDAWDDYLYWQTEDRKTLKRINMLINNRRSKLRGIKPTGHNKRNPRKARPYLPELRALDRGLAENGGSLGIRKKRTAGTDAELPLASSTKAGQTF